MTTDRPTISHRDWDTSAWNRTSALPATTRQGEIYSGSVYVGQLRRDAEHGWRVALRDADLPLVVGFHHENDAIEWATAWLHNERRELTGGIRA